VTGDALNELKMAEAKALTMEDDASATKLLATTKELKAALTGRDLGVVYYVEMLAYSKLEYTAGACTAAKEAKRLLAGDDKRQPAVKMITDNCPK
jgi:hypothetical protein